MYYIYCYTNKINDHKYVGQTNNIERRKREHKSIANNSQSNQYSDLFHMKLREYGEENFIFSILEEIDTDNREIVHQQEIYWIKQMNSFVQNGCGYNLTTGGDGVSNLNRKLSDNELLKLISHIKKGINYIDLSKEFDISISYISMINNGLCFRQESENYPLHQYYKTNEDYSQLVELLKYSDLTLKQIAEKLEMGYSTVKKINSGALRKNLVSDYPIRKRTPQEVRADRVKELLILGATTQEIIKETGVSRETVKRINIGETNKDENLSYPLDKPVSTI